MKKKISFGLIIVFIAIQFIETAHKTTPLDGSSDFIAQTKAPEAIQKILKTSCYDCHSNFTNTPWYGHIAPVSWYINHHINEGREELNFSAWGSYQLKRKKYKIAECWEEIEKGKMPLKNYLVVHKAAKISKENKKTLVAWLKSIDLTP